MKARILKSLIFAVCGCFCALYAMGATSLFSDYGQIQNVQHYSTNPFWTPNSPYNQRMPQPVYVQGTDISADECLKVVTSLVSVQCMARDNCKDTQLTDIRPVVMVQLSNLPGHNYVSACAGYIDTVYADYVSQYGNQIPTRQVAFPTATAPNPDVYNNEYQMNIPNPYKQPAPKWQQEMNERSQELKDLQQQNGADNFSLSATDFPETYADLSFSERMANDAAGYAPYFDKNGYYTLDVKNNADWCVDHIDNPECADYKKQKEAEKKKEKDPTKQKIDGKIMDGIDYILPWYGILVVKKGSLDKVYDSEKPLISPTYMKQHKDKYFPANSGRWLGITRGCTHGNHTANDEDVINRAAHITMDQEDSYFKGNDFYVYDGEDVYWGTAAVIGEIALALVTFGLSAEVEGGMAGAKTAAEIAKVGKSVQSVNVAKNATKEVKAAAQAAKAVTAANKKNVIAQLGKVGVKVSNKASVSQIQRIGTILSNANQNTGWVSALIGANKWRLAKNGAKAIAPKAKNIFSSGASFGRTLAVTALAYGGVKTANSFSDTAHDIFISILKANGYSTSTVPITEDPEYKDLKFNSFGLLSADNIEDHENDISHGTWLSFSKLGEFNSGDENTPGDAEKEAAAFAEEFAKQVRIANAETPLCDIDIYVVHPVIGDPFNTGKKDIYYILYTNPNAGLRVTTE